MEQVVTELYRTNQNKDEHTFKACVTLTYFGKTCFVHSLSDTFNVGCFRDLISYIRSKVQYYRKDVLKVREL